jgi:hypothetical protein
MKAKELFIISLTIFLTITAWIVADVYHIINTKEADEQNTSTMKPINPKIDLKVFEDLQKKQ